MTKTKTEYVGRHRLPPAAWKRRLHRFWFGPEATPDPSPVNIELGEKLLAHHDEEES